MYFGTDKEICLQYYGRDHLLYSKEAEASLFETPQSITRRTSSSSVRYKWTSPNFDNSWLRSPTSGVNYFPSQITIQRNNNTPNYNVPSGQTHYISLAFHFGRSPNSGSHTRFISSVEQADWKLKYRIGSNIDRDRYTGPETELTIPGPFNPNNQGDTSNVDNVWSTSGFYSWIPEEDLQGTLNNLLTALLPGYFTPNYLQLQIPGPAAGEPPTIANFQCRELPGGTLGQDITVNEADFPLQVQFSANITDADRWDFYQAGNNTPLASGPVSYTHLRAHETKANLVCRLLLEKKNK